MCRLHGLAVRPRRFPHLHKIYMIIFDPPFTVPSLSHFYSDSRLHLARHVSVDALPREHAKSQSQASQSLSAYWRLALALLSENLFSSRKKGPRVNRFWRRILVAPNVARHAHPTVWSGPARTAARVPEARQLKHWREQRVDIGRTDADMCFDRHRADIGLRLASGRAR